MERSKPTLLIYFNSLVPSGGIERVIANLAQHLNQSYSITILVKDKAISFYELPSNIQFQSLNSPMKLNMSNRMSRVFNTLITIIKSKKLLNAYLSKNVFDFYYLAHPLNALEIYLARGIDQKVILTEHGAPNGYNYIYKFIKKILYPKAKIYIVPTISDTKYYNNIKIPARYIPHFKTKLPYSKASSKSKQILSIGRFTSVKQHLVLLDIWRSIVYDYGITDWQLILIGNGEEEYNYKKYIEQHHLSKYICLKQPQKKIEEFYLKSSIFALTSKSEGFGMVLLEAISFGLPCVCFDCPSGPRDIIQNNFNGFLIEEGNKVDFKKSILQLIQDDELRERISRNAYNSSGAWEDNKIIKKWINAISQN